MENLSGRKRALRREVRISREAMSVIAPINRQIGPWQASAVRLIVIGERQAGTGRIDAAAEAEAEALEAMVSARHAELRAQITALPPESARSTRIVDTLRALDGVLTGLRRARALLAGPRAAPPAETDRPHSPV